MVLWLCSSHLCVNVLKSNAMLIGNCQKNSSKTLNVSIGSAALRQVSSIRYLGILIDSIRYHGLYMFIMLWQGQISALFNQPLWYTSASCGLFIILNFCTACLYLTIVMSCGVPLQLYKLTSIIERVHSKFVNKLPLATISFQIFLFLN